jgi:hypothetical protein
MAISRSTVASARAMVITHCHRAFELGNGRCPERNGSQNETARKAEKKKYQSPANDLNIRSIVTFVHPSCEKGVKIFSSSGNDEFIRVNHTTHLDDRPNRRTEEVSCPEAYRYVI